MKILFYITSLLLIIGCSSSKVIIGPDGTEHVLVSGFSIESCYSKAREMCKGNYKIVNTSSDTDKDGTEFSLLVKCEAK